MLLREGTVTLQKKRSLRENNIEHSPPTFSLIADCCPTPQTVTQGVQPSEIAGIGFDATCSMVVLDEEGKPISVSHDKNDERNVIMWWEFVFRFCF